MSRLLFAAARGARIEYFDKVDLAWVRSPRIVLHETKVSFRIHPDDLAYQYGPISKVLREEALDSTVVASVYGIEFGTFWLRQTDHAVFQNMSQLERSWFLLILAEALADEGL